MRNSRIALSLLLVLQGAVVIALGNVADQPGIAAHEQAAVPLGFEAHDTFGPRTLTSLSDDSRHVPAILPGVSPLETVPVPTESLVAEQSDCYWYEYDVDYEAIHADESSESVVIESVDAAPENSTCDYDPCYDYERYYSEYGYDSLDQEETIVSINEEPSADHVNADYLGYSLAYPEEENAYPETLSSEPTDLAAEPEALQYNFGDAYGYEYDYSYDYEYDYSYDYEYDYVTEVPQVVEEELPEVAYDYVDPYEYYGHGYEETYDAAVAEVIALTPESDLGFQSVKDLSAWQPAELLLEEDTKRLISLASTVGSDGSVQRNLLRSYLEDLGWYAIDFAAQFEEATGLDVLDLCGDTTAVATFLAAYRLYERGEFDTTATIDLLVQSMENRSAQWLQYIRQLTATQPEKVIPTPEWSAILHRVAPLASAAQTLGSRSVVSLGGVVLGVSSEISGLRWEEIVSQARQLSEACNPKWGNGSIQR